MLLASFCNALPMDTKELPAYPIALEEIRPNNDGFDMISLKDQESTGDANANTAQEEVEVMADQFQLEGEDAELEANAAKLVMDNDDISEEKPSDITKLFEGADAELQANAAKLVMDNDDISEEEQSDISQLPEENDEISEENLSDISEENLSDISKLSEVDESPDLKLPLENFGRKGRWFFWSSESGDTEAIEDGMEATAILAAEEEVSDDSAKDVAPIQGDNGGQVLIVEGKPTENSDQDADISESN